MTNYNNEIERELGWDDEIEKESEFILLPEGRYPFTVTGFERGRFNGSEKLPPCNKAVISCKIISNEGKEVTLKRDLFLHTITEGFLSEFFASIGQKKKGERVKMNWNAVVGSTGECRVTQYTGRDDNKYNEIKSFYPKKEQDDSQIGFTPGQF